MAGSIIDNLLGGSLHDRPNCKDYVEGLMGGNYV